MHWGYFPKAAPRPKPKPGKARKKFGATWWGERWVDVLSNFEHDQRMSRGRAYARADKVKHFRLKTGSITATVEGSTGDYKVDIKFKKFSGKEWDKIIQKLTQVPIVLSGLLNNEMPRNIDKVTGYSFIPSSFESDCSCPDYANPCKHIAAVFYTLADEIDYDPMILFKLKGMEKEQILVKSGVMESAQKEGDAEEKKTEANEKITRQKRKEASKKNLTKKKKAVRKERCTK